MPPIRVGLSLRTRISTIRRRLSARFDILLMGLASLFLLVPAFYTIGMLVHPLVGQIGASAWFALIVSSAVLAVSDEDRSRWVGIGLAVPALVSHILHNFFTGWGIVPAVVSDLLSLLFLAYTNYLLLRVLFSIRRVTANVIWGSICAYLLIGVMWAMAYSLLLRFQPDALEGSGMRVLHEDPVGLTVVTSYFSFVTLTTLGYGDILPRTITMRMLVVLEAVCGQVYLAVLVARLVGIYVAGGRMPRSDDTGEKS
ncbi:MAG: two pore domain potassium channel family protein [Planctomycetota bacterium]|nr:MAG: two pore domain potassium channel family protein [Planctomycetota bacterium]